MKAKAAQRSVRWFALSAAVAVGLGAPYAAVVRAAPKTWDPGATDGAVVGGAGAWDTTTANWTTDAGVSNTTWANGAAGAAVDTAVFGGTTAGTVTLGAAVNAQGLTFDLAGYTVTGNTITLNAGATLAVNQNATVNSVLAGTAGQGNLAFTKTGNGTLTLGGTNTFSGNVTITGGVLAVTGASGLSTNDPAGNEAAATPATRVLLDTAGGASEATVRIGTGYDANNGSSYDQFVFGTGGGTVEVTAGTLTLNDGGQFGNGPSVTGAGRFTKAGAGRLTLANQVFTFDGPTTVAAGTLQLGSNQNSASVLGGGSTAATAVTVNSGAALEHDSDNGVPNQLILNGGSVAGRSEARTYSGAVTLNSATTSTLAIAGSGSNQPVTFSGVVSGDGAVNVTANAGNTSAATFSNAANLFTGDVTIGANAIFAVASMGASTNALAFNGAGATLRTSANITTARTVTVAAGSAANFDVTGGTLTFTSSLPDAPANKSGAGALALQATSTATAGQTLGVSAGQLNYDATGAFGAGLVNVSGAAAQVSILDPVGSSGGTFAVGGNAVIAGNTTTLAGLARGTNLTLTGNPAAGAPAAVVAQTADGVNAALVSSANLGTNADLYFGLGANSSENITVGAGTPWKGIATDRGPTRVYASTGTATLTANSDFTILSVNAQTLTIGNSTATGGTVTLATPNATAESPLTVTVTGTGGGGTVQINDLLSLSNKVRFVVTGGATLQTIPVNALGASTTDAAANASVEVLATGILNPNGGGNTLSGNATIQPGGTLNLDDANNLTGIGTVTQFAGSITRITNNGGTVLGGNKPVGTVPGTIVQISTNGIANMPSKLDNAAIFEVAGANRVLAAGTTASPATPLSLNSAGPVTINGVSVPTAVLTNDTSSRVLSAVDAATGSSNAISVISVGENGATFAATTGTTLTLTDRQSGVDSVSGIRVAAAGNPITIGIPGTTSINLATSKGGVVNYGSRDVDGGFQAGTVDVVAGQFTFGGGGAPFQVGGAGIASPGTGVGTLTVRNGARFQTNSGVLVDARLVVESGATAFANGAAPRIASVEGAGSLSLGGNSTAAGASPFFSVAATASSVNLEVGANGLDTTFSGVISQNVGAGFSGALTKVGAGTLTLTGANTYAGGTVINGGTILASNTGATTSATGTNTVSVNAGGTLGGDGRVAGIVNVNRGGTLSPGASIGTLSIAGPVTLAAVGAGDDPLLAIELRASSPASITDDSDVLALTGAAAAGVLTLDNPDVLNLIALTDVTTPTTYTIATFASRTEEFDELRVNGVTTGNTSNQALPNYVSVVYGTTDIQVTVNNLTGVPEPAAAGLFGVAAAGLLARRSRRKLR